MGIMVKKFLNVKVVLSLIIVFAFVIYLLLNLHSFAPLLHLNAAYLIFIATGTVLGIVSNGLFTKVIMKTFDKPISTKESVFVSLIATAGNFFAPAGSGFGFRAIYLKRKHKLSYSDYLSMLSGNYVVVFLIVSIVGIASLLLIHTNDQIGAVKTTLWLIFLALFAFSSVLLFIKVPKKILNSKEAKGILKKPVQILVRISTGWNAIISDHSLVVKLLGLIILNTCISIVSTALIIAALHFTVTLPALLLFSALGSLSTFINITPANLGIKEAVYIASSSVLGLTTGEILSIALVDRAVTFFVLALLWILFGRSSRLKVELKN